MCERHQGQRDRQRRILYTLSVFIYSALFTGLLDSTLSLCEESWVHLWCDTNNPVNPRQLWTLAEKQITLPLVDFSTPIHPTCPICHHFYSNLYRVVYGWPSTWIKKKRKRDALLLLMYLLSFLPAKCLLNSWETERENETDNRNNLFADIPQH